MKTYLSKSKVLSGRQCVKRLFLEVHKPQLAAQAKVTDRLLSRGLEVHEVARRQYPDGILISHDDNLSMAIEDTKQVLLRNPSSPIFEATFQHDGVLVRSDVFFRGTSGFRLIEVKSSTTLKPYQVEDCAVQAWVIQGQGLALESVNLAVLDTSFVYPGDDNYNGLFHFEDCTDAVSDLQNEVPAWIDEFRRALDGPDPTTEIGPQCGTPFQCPFLDYCSLGVPCTDYPVTCLPKHGKIVSRLVEEGFKDIRDIPEDRLENATFERIRRSTVSGLPEIDPAVGEYLRSFEYPRYFLDFETIDFPVPIWAGTRPYQHIPFQWSCHCRKDSLSLDHKEFLDNTGCLPMKEFAKSLLDALGYEGPIFVYSHYEKRILNELAAFFPDLAIDLENLTIRLVDLLKIVKGGYYHPLMKGSFSIKAVLPTITSGQTYETLGEVADGIAAQEAYLEIVNLSTPAGRKSVLRKSLLDYCGLDTMSLVELVDFFERN